LRLGRSAPIGIAEESYAFAQLLSRGYRAVHVPDAIVVHPVTNGDLEQRATSSVAYWLLLFSEFPGHRMDLLRFLTRRLRRKPLTWPRNPQAPGELIMSGWRVYWRADRHPAGSNTLRAHSSGESFRIPPGRSSPQSGHRPLASTLIPLGLACVQRFCCGPRILLPLASVIAAVQEVRFRQRRSS
jgi:hypothetical protein